MCAYTSLLHMMLTIWYKTRTSKEESAWKVFK